jgi:hypothetical protein
MPRLTEEKMLTETLYNHFRLEAEFEGGNGQFCALTPRDNGGVKRHRPMSPASPRPTPEQLMFAADVLALLNEELHHNGAWVIVFTHPKPPVTETLLLVDGFHSEYGRYALTWLDNDGDPQCVQEWMEGSSSELRDFNAVLRQGGPLPIAQKAESLWQAAAEMRGVLELKAEQTFKQAAGQSAPSTRH